MTRNEMLLNTLSEECAEVIQRVGKALRFGIHEIEQGQSLTNADRILQEFTDIAALVEMCQMEGILPTVDLHKIDQAIDEKKAKVEKWLAYSKEMGTLQ